MCEINPAHELYFRLEVFTSNSNESAEDFECEVSKRVLDAEIALNADGRYRFHVHPVKKPLWLALSFDEIDKETLDTKCPHCGAEPLARCTVVKGEGRGREMGTVHTARVKAAARRVNSGA